MYKKYNNYIVMLVNIIDIFVDHFNVHLFVCCIFYSIYICITVIIKIFNSTTVFPLIR